MIKKTIKYTNFNGVEREKDFYFHLKKTDLMDLQYRDSKGFLAYIQEITDANDESGLWKAFRDLILLAYGEKSDDGEQFIRNEELSKKFEQSEAFSVLIDEFMNNEGAAADFVNGIMPANLTNDHNQKEADKA